MSFEVGDKVWDVRYGDGEVLEISNDLSFPIGVEFKINERIRNYTSDGKADPTDTYPSLYFFGTQIMPAPEPERCPFNEGDLVLCRDHEEQKWQVHRFLRYVDYNITCKFMTTTSSPHNVTNYRYCLPLAGNEHLFDTKDNKEE